MQTRLWVVPGFAGSELFLVTGSSGGKATAGRKLWIDAQSAAGGLDTQALTYPTPPHLGTVVPGALVDSLGYGYGSLTRYLVANVPSDWQVMPYPYDWRRDVLSVASELVTAITSRPAVPGGDRIVCHSYGASIACAAYGLMAQSNLQGRVPRIVTIGGILAGSYGSVKTWLFQEDSVNQLALAAYNPFREPRGYGFGNVTAARVALVRLYNSWPSVYDMLPDPAQPDDPGDALRGKVWDATTWSNAPVPPDAGLLASSRGLFQAFRAQASNWPPPGVLVNVCGTGQSTPYRLQPSSQPARSRLQYQIAHPTASGFQYALSQLPAIALANTGDNRATIASQSRPGCQLLLVIGAHSHLISHPVVLGSIIPLLAGPGTASGASSPAAQPVWPLSA